MQHWMFNCKEVSQRVSASLDRNPSLGERMLIGIHLMMCKYCYRFKKHLLMLREFSRSRALLEKSVDPSVGLPADARERIKRTVSTSLS